MAVSGFDVSVWLTPRVRRWLYGVGAAVTALLGVYGLLDGVQIAAWNAVLVGVLGVAFVNVNDVDDLVVDDEAAPVGFVLPE